MSRRCEKGFDIGRVIAGLTGQLTTLQSTRPRWEIQGRQVTVK